MANTETLALEDFGVDDARGFLPADDPLVALGQGFEAWEALAQDLPKRMVSGRVRAFIEALPPFPVEALGSERARRRAMVLLSYLGHAYVWGDGAPCPRIPAVLARPWCAVAAALGRPPVLSYASYALDNWRRLDAHGPLTVDNIALIQNFMGGVDEEWFILIHIDIEARAAQAIRALSPAQASAARGEVQALTGQLTEVWRAIEGMHATLARMPEFCDPYIYFHRVRPYIHGWKNNPATPDGVVYEGVEAFGGAPQLLRGETGAQSAIVPCLDAALGVYHADDPLKTYLLEMRDYMPPGHRRFLEALEGVGPVRGFVERSQDPALQEAYDGCVRGVEGFRALHLEYAASYIFHQAQTSRANPSAVGTGGTPFMKYLKKHRDETGEHVLGASKDRQAPAPDGDAG